MVLFHTITYISVSVKRPDKSTISYAMLDFKSYVENLQRKYLVIERHTFTIFKV